MNYSSIGIFYSNCKIKNKKTIKKYSKKYSKKYPKKYPKKSIKKYRTIKFSKFL